MRSQRIWLCLLAISHESRRAAYAKEKIDTQTSEPGPSRPENRFVGRYIAARGGRSISLSKKLSFYQLFGIPPADARFKNLYFSLLFSILFYFMRLDRIVGGPT